jgi:GT2 family glycosyltransferase
LKIDRVSIVIPCYNRLEYTKVLVSSIRSKREIEIIIVDDCSEDGTGEWATNQGYTLISHNQRMGVPKGWNDGIKKSLEMNIDYIIISNNDVILHKDCINNLVDHFEYKVNSLPYK